MDWCKIIGIEVSIMPGYLRISQGKYIENLLHKENMAEANPVGMPLDPNIKIGPNPIHNEPNRRRHSSIGLIQIGSESCANKWRGYNTSFGCAPMTICKCCAQLQTPILMGLHVVSG